MDPQQDCPSKADWLQILKACLPGLSPCDSAQHLDSCCHCQAVVEELTEGSRTWLPIAAELRQPVSHLPRACRRALEEVQEHPFSATPQPSDAGFPHECAAREVGGDLKGPNMTPCIHIERMLHRSSIAVAGESAAGYALVKLIPSGLFTCCGVRTGRCTPASRRT
jgi:hypothetical protein